MKKYLTVEDVPNARTGTIEAIKQENVEGVPRLVIYLKEERKGLLLTRELAEDLTKALGPHPLVTKFFKLN